MQGSIKIEAGEKKLTDVTTSMKNERKYTERTEILRSRGGRQEEKGIHELKRGIRKKDGSGRKSRRGKPRIKYLMILYSLFAHGSTPGATVCGVLANNNNKFDAVFLESVSFYT